MEEPPVQVGGGVEVDSDFEDGEAGYAEVASQGGHGWEKTGRGGRREGEVFLRGEIKYCYSRFAEHLRMEEGVL